MQTMYPGKVNSPQTELASAIDDEQTTIPLLDAGVLPDPPNICTIGTGEDAETVLYEGIDGNDLTGVTRGVEGDAKSWVAGTKVARNFTNRDYEAIRNNIGDMSTVPTTSKNAAGAITELFTSVSDGKALVAGAITDKGVPTNPSDTFATMAANIESIPVGPDTSDATVTAGDLRAGKVAYGKDDARIVGTLPVRSGGNVVPGPSDIVKDAGIYDTPITVKGVVVPADKVMVGTTIAGTPGTMPNRGNVNQTLTQQGQEYTVQQGYHGGGGKIIAQFANLIPSNVRDKVNIGGVIGNLVEGKPFATGSLTSSGRDVTVSGLSFLPAFIIVRGGYNGSIETRIYAPNGLNNIGKDANNWGTIIAADGTAPVLSGERSWTITSNGFTCLVDNQNSPFTWWAFGA